MSIPERFYRIAKHKLTEIKDRIDQWDAEAQEDPEVVEKRRQKRARNVAKRELDDAMTDPATTGKPPAVDVAPVPLNPPPARRTPEEIARGSRSYASTGPAGSTTSSAQPLSQPDPLEYHYRLLGVEVGTDFTTVQAAYNKLAARCEPSRFPAGSPEARQAQEIRDRLETSYKTLRDALDPTARRFDLLELEDRRPSA